MKHVDRTRLCGQSGDFLGGVGAVALRLCEGNDRAGVCVKEVVVQWRYLGQHEAHRGEGEQVIQGGDFLVQSTWSKSRRRRKGKNNSWKAILFIAGL